ncbi:uncharacterized protein YALI1_E24812g [Yarrowia lipolytica]|uniref:Uncharacterized protein n=1 Tax=Yarrowia lipolytica TaxID=4952 RepID=A0A1D8NJD1_YARLL|nr:hypothetical protein YALI1_E24812g [Yarrowia lipolytica]
MALTCPDKSKKRQATVDSSCPWMYTQIKKYVHLEEGCWSDSFSKGTPLVKRFVECRIFVVFFGSSDC